MLLVGLEPGGPRRFRTWIFPSILTTIIISSLCFSKKPSRLWVRDSVFLMWRFVFALPPPAAAVVRLTGCGSCSNESALGRVPFLRAFPASGWGFNLPDGNMWSLPPPPALLFSEGLPSFQGRWTCLQIPPVLLALPRSPVITSKGLRFLLERISPGEGSVPSSPPRFQVGVQFAGRKLVVPSATPLLSGFWRFAIALRALVMSPDPSRSVLHFPSNTLMTSSRSLIGLIAFFFFENHFWGLPPISILLHAYVIMIEVCFIFPNYAHIGPNTHINSVRLNALDASGGEPPYSYFNVPQPR